MSKQLVIAGASNQIAAFLVPMLLAGGWQVIAISRRQKPPWVSEAAGLNWQQLDLASDPVPEFKARVLLHLAPLELFSGLAAALPNLETVIASSSTSRFTKIESADPAEQATARGLASGEQALTAYCQERGLGWSLLRPTLIYGAGLDHSLTRLSALIKRLRFLPLPGEGLGGRQPVHAEDLAEAIVQLLQVGVARNQEYELCGGETLSYREMVRRIFESLGIEPRIVQLPLPLMKLGLLLLRLHPRYRDVGPSMLDRINQDLVFDCSQARADFGYQARKFAPRREDWLPLQER